MTRAWLVFEPTRLVSEARMSWHILEKPSDADGARFWTLSVLAIMMQPRTVGANSDFPESRSPRTMLTMDLT